MFGSQRVTRDCTGGVLTGGGDGTTSEVSTDYDDQNWGESDEKGRNSCSPDADDATVVTSSNFDLTWQLKQHTATFKSSDLFRVSN